MKKLFKRGYPIRVGIAFALIAMAFFIHSCKRNGLPPQPAFTGNAVSVEIKTWLATQKKDTLTSIAINKLIDRVDWQTAHAVDADTLTYLIAKLSADPQILDDSTKRVTRYLIVVKNRGKVTDAYQYDILGDAAKITQRADDLITSYGKSLNLVFTGNLTKLTLNSAFKESDTYADGLMAKHLVLVGKKRLPTVSIQSTKKVNDDQNCTDWYMVTYENGQEVDEEYLFTTCDDDCPLDLTTYYAKNRLGVLSVNLKPYCGGGGNTVVVDTTKIDTVKKVIDSCAQAKKIAATQAFVNKMNSMKNHLSDDAEMGYQFVDPSDPSSYSLIQGDPHTMIMPFTVIGKIGGYIHVHPDGVTDINGNYFLDDPTPSHDDFETLYKLYQAGNMSDPSSFIMATLASQNTAYSIQITNEKTFATWAASNLTIVNNHSAFQDAVDVSFNHYYNDLSMDINLSHELAMLDNLASSGLTVSKGDYATMTNWHPEIAINKTVIPINCN